jgi:transposase
MKNFLSQKQELSYKSLHKRYKKDQRKSDRIKAILMLNKGYTYTEISEVLLLDDSTIRRWHEIFTNSGIKTLLEDKYLGGISRLTNEQQEKLSFHLGHNIYLTAKEICFYVQEEFDVVYTVKGMTSLLHQLGFSYKKPKKVPGKVNKEKQQEFIATYRKIKEDKSAEDRIYFMDGVHPLHNAQPAFGWIKKGKEQVIKTNTGRQRVNINGAYDIEGHKAIIREDESINAQSTIKLLEQILKEQPIGIIYIILDNARYYRSRLVQEFLAENPRIQLIFLPPYSPNLNIVERLWKFFKKKTTYNKYYEKFSVFKEKCMDFFENIEEYENDLKSLMVDNFQLIQA